MVTVKFEAFRMEDSHTVIANGNSVCEGIKQLILLLRVVTQLTIEAISTTSYTFLNIFLHFGTEQTHLFNMFSEDHMNIFDVSEQISLTESSQLGQRVHVCVLYEMLVLVQILKDSEFPCCLNVVYFQTNGTKRDS